jgi:phosphoglycerate dehydrogenase-like enzyme
VNILVTDRNLVVHRERFTAGLPPDAEVRWLIGEPDAAMDELRDAEVYVGGRFTAEMAGVAGKLRLIHVVGAGTDRIDFRGLSSDIQVANTFHHERSIAEYVLAAAIVLARDFLAQDRSLRRDVWATSVYDDTIAQSKTLRDSRIGFVGFGHIGQFSWELFRTFGSSGAAVTGSGRIDAAKHGLAWVGDTSRRAAA